MDYKTLKLSDITIGDNRRLLGDIESLAASIQEIGLLNPITVTTDYQLIAGHHRIKAFELLGMDTIPARIIDCTALQAELAEIDENLIRNELTALDKGLQMARRKAIYLELYPETRAGVAGGKAGGNGREKVANDTMSFATDTAAKTKTSKRTVERNVEIGEVLRDLQDEIREAGIDDSQKDLLALAKLQSDSPDIVILALSIIGEGEAKNIQAAVRKIKKDALNTLEQPTGKYRVIYADPPWSYNDKQDTELLGGAEKHYPSMTINELCELPIDDIAEDNAVLFMWVTSPLLESAFPIIGAWGFKYKTSFVWDKIKHNMGHYNSVRHELLLVCTRGSCTPDNVQLFDSVQSIERTRHSEKPEMFRNIIDTLYKAGSRIELFCRGEAPENWTAWGNEASEAI